jgi:tetratricopeptide (TPR) repeat protein
MRKTFPIVILAFVIGVVLNVLSDPYFFTSAKSLYEIGIEKSDEGNDAINVQGKKEAAEYFQRAIDKGLNEREAFVKLYWASSYVYGQPKLEKILTNALNVFPNDLEFLFRRAESRMEQKKFELAIEDFNVVINSDSAYEYKDYAIYGRGSAWYMLGETGKASKDFNLLSRLTGEEWRGYEDYSKRFK